MEVCYLNFRGTAMLELCFSKTDEQQRWNCVIQIQMNSNAWIVLFKYRWTATLELCDSNTEEQQCSMEVCFLNFRGTAILEVCFFQIQRNNNAPWRCFIQIQRNSNAGIVLFKYRGTSMLHGDVLY